MRGEAKVKTADCQKQKQAGNLVNLLVSEWEPMNAKDYLKQLMDFQRRATITFRSVNGGVSVIKAKIVNLDATGGKELVETDAGLIIELDHILEIDGHSFENIC